VQEIGVLPRRETTLLADTIVKDWNEVAVAHATLVARVPHGADLARITAALVNGATVWVALHELARLDVRDDVLVLGASGGLGRITGRLAAAHPANRVIGAARRPPTDPAWTHTVTDLETIRDLTRGRGVDIVIDPVGGSLRRHAYELFAPFGRLVVLGNASGHDEPLSADAAWLGSRQIRASPISDSSLSQGAGRPGGGGRPGSQ
jgi:NADPH2:quinone reductase